MMVKVEEERRVQGQAICSGIAIGRVFILNLEEVPIREVSLTSSQVDAEVMRYRMAIQHSIRDVQVIQQQLHTEDALEGVAILDTHIHMMQDPMMTTKVEDRIRDSKKNAESVFQEIIRQYQVRFDQIEDELFRERFRDILDIGRRVMSYLGEGRPKSLADVPMSSIVFAEELVPTDTAEAKLGGVNAFVTRSGGATSHAAIVAKAKGIPFVSGVDLAAVEGQEGERVIVDGRSGEVILNPTEQTLSEYTLLRDQIHERLKRLEQAVGLKTETYDGYQVRLSANIEMTSELEGVRRYRDIGVGLFRSEYLYLSREEFPSEEEQYEIYRSLMEQMKGLPVVIRTFDVGGDKVVDRKAAVANSPILGMRAIRFLLKEKEIFRNQLRALLRASAHGEVGIMFPMISGLPELVEAKAILAKAKEELLEEGKEVGRYRVGCMVELPSAVMICDLLARECDFVSIGTNDLVQFSLAVDRATQAVSGIYGPTHPSVVRMMKMVAAEANRKGVAVSVCGEVAADPRFTPFLLGIGVKELSVAERFLPIVKYAIRNTSIVEAVRFADYVLSLETAYDIQEALLERYRQTVPDDLLGCC